MRRSGGPEGAKRWVTRRKGRRFVRFLESTDTSQGKHEEYLLGVRILRQKYHPCHRNVSPFVVAHAMNRLVRMAGVGKLGVLSLFLAWQRFFYLLF